MREDQKKTLAIFAFVGLVAGIVLTCIGFTKWRVYREGSPVPVEMTPAELSRGGPPANKHVRLRDCVPTDNYVHLGLKDSANFSRIWQPLIVSGAGQGARGIVITSDDILDEKKMGPIRASQVDGLVVTDGHLLPEEARRQCWSAGGGDYSDPIVIELNGYPSRAKVYGLFGGGIALTLLVVGSVGGYFALRALPGQSQGGPRRKRSPRLAERPRRSSRDLS